MPNNNGSIDAANAAGIKEGRKPTMVPAPPAVSPELSPRPQRRTFSAAAKLRILEETDRAADTGGIAAILRREGLYSSALTDWRRQRDAGAFEALKPLRRGPKPEVAKPAAADFGQLRRENARLRQRLEHAEAIIGIQKKLQPCWGYRWRRPRTTRRHDAGRHRLARQQRPHGKRLCRSRTGTRQRLSRPHAPSSATPCKVRQARAAAGAWSRRAQPCARSSANTPVPRSGPRGDLCHLAGRGRLSLLDPHPVSHPGRKRRGPRTPRPTPPSRLSEAGAAGRSPQPSLVVGYYETDGTGQMVVFLPVCHPRYLQPPRRRLVCRRC